MSLTPIPEQSPNVGQGLPIVDVSTSLRRAATLSLRGVRDRVRSMRSNSVSDAPPMSMEPQLGLGINFDFGDDRKFDVEDEDEDQNEVYEERKAMKTTSRHDRILKVQNWDNGPLPSSPIVVSRKASQSRPSPTPLGPSIRRSTSSVAKVLAEEEKTYFKKNLDVVIDEFTDDLYRQNAESFIAVEAAQRPVSKSAQKNMTRKAVQKSAKKTARASPSPAKNSPYTPIGRSPLQRKPVGGSIGTPVSFVDISHLSNPPQLARETAEITVNLEKITGSIARSGCSSSSIGKVSGLLGGISTAAHQFTPYGLHPEGVPKPLKLGKKPEVIPDTKSQPTNTTILQPFSVSSPNPTTPRHKKGKVVVPSSDTPTGHRSYGHHILSVPKEEVDRPAHSKDRNKSLSDKPRGSLYFYDAEREAILQHVSESEINCRGHPKTCTDCHELEFTHIENKAMSTSVPPEERQKIIAGNRALRNIKTELETLSENGFITDDVYDKIINSLPNELSLNSSARPTAAPVNDFQNLNISNEAPPAYNNPNPPSVPTRSNSSPASKPEIGRATALYRYAEPDDCTFEVGDNIAVYEHMNKDWWLGKNLRTGKEGVFPVNYVQVQMNSAPSPAPYQAPGGYGNEKSNNPYGGYNQQPQYQQQGPPPPGPSNPYNAAVPPMQIAEQPSESKPGKGQEMGKKFGKKLGNAAIFGAGATIGGKIVNGIF